MDSVKRRLVYVADENEELVKHLTTGGTPPTRASRFSRLHVSSSGSSQSSAKDGPTLELASPVPVPVVDPLLIVSYDGNLVADGSGNLRCPRNYGEARLLRRELRKCQAFLTRYMHQVSSSASAEDESEEDVSDDGSSSSSSYTASSISTDDDDSEDDESPRRRRNGRSNARRGQASKRAGRTNSLSVTPAEIASMTVATLRSALRDRGLPVAGNKAALEERLLLFTEEGQTEGESCAAHSTTGAHNGSPAPSTRLSAAGGAGVKRQREHSSSGTRSSLENCGGQVSHRSTTDGVDTVTRSRLADSDRSVTSADSGALTTSSSPPSSTRQRFSHVVSPPARVSTAVEPARQSRGLWGALVNVGSRIFGQSAASQSPYSPLNHRGELPHEADVKRRRSA